MTTRLLLLIVISLHQNSMASEPTIWNLTTWGYPNDDYFVSSIAVYINRAFLAVPRSSCSDPNTLIEVPWGNIVRTSNRVPQTCGECSGHLQNATSVQIDKRRARLWVLDKGTSLCPPKVMVYSLMSMEVVLEESLEDFANVSCLALDPKEPVGYIGAANGLLVMGPNSETRLVGLSLKILPRYMAFSRVDSVLYIGEEGGAELFSANLMDIREMVEVNVTKQGERLGPAKCLETDLKGGVLYYLPRDCAIVRWNTKGPLIAEFHDILAQSCVRLPDVIQIFTDSRGSVWGLVQHPYAAPEGRLVKIMRYSGREEATIE